MMRSLTEAECLKAIAEGDFSPELRGAADSVAIILSQSWCPQWKWMRDYLAGFPESPNRAFFFVEYDREPFFEEFMAFKEDVFGNREVPYVRYYRGGSLRKTSNFIDKGGFLRLLEGS